MSIKKSINSFFSRLWINKSAIFKLACTYIGVVFTFWSFVSLFNPLDGILPNDISFFDKLLIGFLVLLTVFILSVFVAGCYVLSSHQVCLGESSTKNSVYVKYGDMYSPDIVEKGYHGKRAIVVSVNRCFDTIVDDLSFRANVETDEQEVEQMLKVIQEFDPAGVGARNLQECLLLQMKHVKKSPEAENAIKILKHHFNEFSNKHYQKIINRMGISQEELKAAMAKILKLNPSPGGQIDDTYNDQAQQIIPDFLLEYRDGKLLLSMPRFSVPELKVNRKYADLLMEAANSSEREKKEAAAFVKKKLDSAKWFVEAIKQRHNTLQSTMQAIIDYQQEYFIDGDETHLKPMVLKDIAERTGFDISTISRVVNSKYIETHFGIYSLKYFFSEGLENQDGEEVSTRELKKALVECVENENKSKPLIDDELVEEMTKRGYKVARRTIAKYRDQLSIPKARLRKEL